MKKDINEIAPLLEFGDATTFDLSGVRAIAAAQRAQTLWDMVDWLDQDECDQMPGLRPEEFVPMNRGHQWPIARWLGRALEAAGIERPR